MSKKIEIETPCTVSWNSMQGDAKVKCCSKCRFNVYNFAEMTQTGSNPITKW